MKNGEWVKTQFGLPKKHKNRWRYRDVLLITSFIETVIRDIAASDGSTRLGFKESLKALGLRIDSKDEKESSYEQDCQYRQDCLSQINAIRVQRNELLHDIIRRDLPEEYIDGTIKQMASNIRHICTESHIVREFFVTNYEFDPAESV